MKKSIDIEIYLSFIICFVIGMIFGTGITEWGKELEKDSFTDWIIAICTVLIVIGTLLASFYAKRALYFSKKTFYSENLDILLKFDREVLCLLKNKLLRCREFRKELNNFIFNKYDYITTFIYIAEQLKSIEDDFNDILKKIEENSKEISFVINKLDVKTLSFRINMLLLGLSSMKAYKADNVLQNIDEIKSISKVILQRFDELDIGLNLVGNMINDIYEY